MSILKNKKLPFLFFFLFFSACSIQYKMAPDFSIKVQKTKRVIIWIDPESGFRKKESSLLSDITKNIISHHKEFLVYSTPEKFSGNCGKEIPKVEGIILVKPKQVIQDGKINLTIQISLLQCPSKDNLWESWESKKFSMQEKQNESLRNTYTQKYGKEIDYAVNPYYLLTKEILESLQSPELSEEEKDEKIELDSL
jgi:probable lipoprotein (TIGR04455 family)